VPKVIDGGGYRTQIILINTSTTQGMVYINFFDDKGNAVGVPLQ
jgi:hypothetical protein